MIRHAVGIGVNRVAIEEGIEDRHDHQQLDGDGQRDLATEWLLQEFWQVFFIQVVSISARRVPARKTAAVKFIIGISIA